MNKVQKPSFKLKYVVKIINLREFPWGFYGNKEEQFVRLSKHVFIHVHGCLCVCVCFCVRMSQMQCKENWRLESLMVKWVVSRKICLFKSPVVFSVLARQSICGRASPGPMDSQCVMQKQKCCKMTALSMHAVQIILTPLVLRNWTFKAVGASLPFQSSLWSHCRRNE